MKAEPVGQIPTGPVYLALRANPDPDPDPDPPAVCWIQTGCYLPGWHVFCHPRKPHHCPSPSFVLSFFLICLV